MGSGMTGARAMTMHCEQERTSLVLERDRTEEHAVDCLTGRMRTRELPRKGLTTRLVSDLVSAL